MISKKSNTISPDLDRLPKELQGQIANLYRNDETGKEDFLNINQIHQGDATELLKNIKPNSIDVSVWSPPYFVGKDYEAGLTYKKWKEMLETVIRLHFPIIKPGCFLVINIADILVFKDKEMPKIQADVISRRRSPITTEDVLRVMTENPSFNKYQIANVLGCSEQTVDRRLHGNNIRGGKYKTQTRVKIVGGLVEDWAIKAGFYTYDRRAWVKDPAWENSKWASLSYRSIDEFEYIYIFWKPGITKVDRKRLEKAEWKEWGSRGVWYIASVRSNDDHEAKFPVELPRRVIKLLTDPGDLIMDCFIGSGTTAIAAIKENRNFIGIDLEEKYVELAKKNIARETDRDANSAG